MLKQDNRRDMLNGKKHWSSWRKKSSITDERAENEGCESAINGKLKTIHMEPRVNEKYDLSQFLQGKRANVLKKICKESLL